MPKQRRTQNPHKQWEVVKTKHQQQQNRRLCLHVRTPKIQIRISVSPEENCTLSYPWRITALERTTVYATAVGSLNAFNWYQIFALDSVDVKTKIITHYDGTKKRARDSQIARAKVNPKLSHGGPSQRQASGANQPIKTSRQGCH